MLLREQKSLAGFLLHGPFPTQKKPVPRADCADNSGKRYINFAVKSDTDQYTLFYLSAKGMHAKKYTYICQK